MEAPFDGRDECMTTQYFLVWRGVPDPRGHLQDSMQMLWAILFGQDPTPTQNEMPGALPKSRATLEQEKESG